jgi:hypothetical protein
VGYVVAVVWREQRGEVGTQGHDPSRRSTERAFSGEVAEAVDGESDPQRAL